MDLVLGAEDEPSQPFLLISVGFQGGRGLVSSAVKLILAVKKQCPFSLCRAAPVLMDELQPWLQHCRQLPSPSASPNQQISFIPFKKQEMYSSICLVFNKVLELP